MTNQELQSTIVSAVAGGINEERSIIRAVQACVYVTEARVRHHLHALRSTRIGPSEQVYSVVRYCPAMNYRCGAGTYGVM